jgi:hypothetical protein
VQRCGHKLPRVHNLITLGGQHQGVANTPGCATDLTGVAATACTAMQVLLARGAYAPWVRENLVQAQYFKVRVDRGCGHWVAWARLVVKGACSAGYPVGCCERAAASPPPQ